MNTELIQLKEVVKKFKSNLVLDGVNLSIPEGKITGIIGASGEGKSTILKLMIGFYKPNSGEVLYLKRSVYEDILHIRKTFGFATEDGSFYENLTVLENLNHFGRLYHVKGSELKERVQELLEFIGLEKAGRTKAKDLSVGMKKRLDIACSVIHKPDVLIMDEPTADLDPLLRNQILSLINYINKEGTTIVLTTQLLEEMDNICDKIAILYNKKIVDEDEPSKIKRKYRALSLNEVFQQIFGKAARRYHKEREASSSDKKNMQDSEAKKTAERENKNASMQNSMQNEENDKQNNQSEQNTEENKQ